MFEVPDARVPSGSVVQVIQPGYMIGDRMLRPALVGVSKGGPRTAPTPSASGAAAGGGGGGENSGG
jgi:molecular chaperone GrpE